MAVQGSVLVAEPPVTNRGLRFFSKLLFCAVVLLIFMGALVKSHEAGLAVPDWPTSYGENMFTFPPSKWIGGIFYEHVHRLVASAVGALTLSFMIWCLVVEERRWVRALAVLALLAVVTQGVLGGLTVIYKLPDAISVAHGILAQTFLLITLALAYSYSEEFAEKRELDSSPRIFKIAIIALIFLFVQLLLGALTRHAEAGLALLDFPTMGGTYLPRLNQQTVASANEVRQAHSLSPVSLYQITLHVLHRMMGMFLLLLAIYLPVAARRASALRFRRHTLLISALVFAQFALGAAVILTLRMPYLASLHVMLGAIILAATGLLVLRAAPHKCSSAR